MCKKFPDLLKELMQQSDKTGPVPHSVFMYIYLFVAFIHHLEASRYRMQLWWGIGVSSGFHGRKIL